MTYAEALDLLELSATEAADVQRIRDAYARRRGQLQSQLAAAAAAPVRAAYQETLEAVDVAAAMLQTRAARPPAPAKGPPAGTTGATRPQAPPPPQTTVPKAPAGDRPDWITATPWHNIQNESRGEFRSADGAPPTPRGTNPAAPRPTAQPERARPSAQQAQKQPAPAQSPAPRGGAGAPPAKGQGTPPGRIAPSLTMRLPESLQRPAPAGAPAPPMPSQSEEMRPVATSLRARPRVPSHFPELDDLPGRSRWGAGALLVLLIGGAVAAGGWAWHQGALDGLLPDGRPSVTDAQSLDEAGQADPVPQATEQPAPVAPIDPGRDAMDIQNQLAQRKAEIEQFAAELSRLAHELGGIVAIDWRAQLAAAEALAAAGDFDQAADDLALLHDTLRTQTDAASRVLTSRQRLKNAGVIDAETPTSSAAAGYLESLSRQAEVSIAEGNYASAAHKYERALDARLRLPRDVEAMEPARAEAAAQHERIRAAVRVLDVDEAAAQKIIGDGTAAETLAGRGPLIDAWLADERPSSELVKEYEQLGASLRGIADRLDRILELRGTAQASLKELAQIEAEINRGPSPPEQLASLLEAGSAQAGATQGAEALRAGRLDDAVEAYEEAAKEAANRSASAVRVRDLLLRRDKAAENLAQAAPAAEARFEELRVQLAAKADASDGVTAQSWRQAAQRIAADAGSLLHLADPAGGEVGQGAAALEVHVRQAELRAEAFVLLAEALEALGGAEQRLLLVRELSAGAQANPEVLEVPLPAANQARASMGRLVERDFAGEDLASVRQDFDAAIEQTESAANNLAAPAAASLVQSLHAKQASYRQQFGAIDLAGIWQPKEPLPEVIPPGELAGPVSAALAAKADADSLGRALAMGGVGEAEIILKHVRALDGAAASLTALREAAQLEGEGGVLALHESAAAGEIQQVRALLALGVSPAPRDAQGRTPLGLALAAGNYDIVKLLLESGGKPPGWLEAGTPVVFVAAASPEALRLLLEHGAPAGDLHRGETALHALAWQANRQQVGPARQIEAARLLLEAHVDVQARNRSNQTAAQLAASLNLRELAEFLDKAPPKRDEP